MPWGDPNYVWDLRNICLRAYLTSDLHLTKLIFYVFSVHPLQVSRDFLSHLELRHRCDYAASNLESFVNQI